MGFKLLLQKGYKPEVIEKIQLKITDRSIVSKTARLGATINLANVKDDPEYLEVNTDIKSELAVPILSPTTKVVIGVLNAESTIEGTYNAEDEIILEALAEKIAQFVHIEETNSRFLAMHNLLYEINSEEISELEDIFRYVVDFVDATFNYKLFAILLINKETNELEMKVHRGYEDPTISEFKVTIDTKKSFVAKCARENRTLNEGDVRKVDCYYEGDSNVLSELAVPITLDNEVIGVINVESTMVDGFSNIDERLLEMLSKILVMTIKTKIK